VGVLVAPTPQPFAASVAAIDDDVAARMVGRSWRVDARVPALADLRYVRVRHRTLDGGIAEGELVVAAGVARPAITLLARWYAIGFPIHRMQLVDDFDADDERSMAADNSSAFNLRPIAGTTTLSQHSFGRALDINPRENPMVWPGQKRFVPAAGREFLDRGLLRPGMIVRPGPVTAILDELGWEWGGDWVHVADLHHLVWLGPAFGG
jgi:D-alanyl-D-alanine carboxypeptidase